MPTTSADLEARPGFKVVTCQKGPQAGRKVLRVLWPEHAELKRLNRLLTFVQQAGGPEEEDAAWAPVYKLLAEFLPNWTFRDRMDMPLEQPQDNPVVFERLDNVTLLWFMPGQEGSIWKDVFPNVK